MISQRVAQYLRDRGIDPAGVAEAVGIDAGALSDALAGRRTLAAEEYAAICAHLDVPIDTFLSKRAQRPE